MSSRQDHDLSPVSGLGTPYRNILAFIQDRDRIELLSVALKISPRNVRKDDCGQWTIAGPRGWLQTCDDLSFGLYIAAHSSRKWSAIKRRAKTFGWEITIDGDDEGCIRLGLPNEVEASFLRSLLGLKRRPVRLDETDNK
jgi:hypothetical protein